VATAGVALEQWASADEGAAAVLDVDQALAAQDGDSVAHSGTGDVVGRAKLRLGRESAAGAVVTAVDGSTQLVGDELVLGWWTHGTPRDSADAYAATINDHKSEVHVLTTYYNVI
jgi:hypothetical protein